MITPLDIENKRFSKQMKGYNCDEVDDFLDELTLEYGKIYKENAELKSQREDLDDSVGKYKNIETSLQNTLVMAQKTADEIVDVAKKQAEQIVRDAEHQAKTVMDETNIEIINKQKEISNLKKDIEVYKAKMESLLIAQLEILKEIKEDE